MGPKRSRRSSSISEESMSITDNNEDSYQSGSSTISTRKRKRVVNSKLKLEYCGDILDKLKLAKSQDGRILTDNFMKLPSKRVATDYYDVISSPIDLTRIQMKWKNDEYDNFEGFESDMELMISNAKTYHTSSAQEYQDAVMLYHYYEQEKQNFANKIDAKAESISGSEGKSRRSRKRVAISIDDGMSDQISLATSDDSRNTSEFSADTCFNPLELFFASIVGQKTDAGKDISPTFTYLPSKTIYPQYYEVIKEPIDLRLIAQRIKLGTYLSIDDVERDFLLMIKNAKVFNETKSEVYQDALELHKIVKMKRSEIDSTGKIPPKPKRGRKKKAPNLITEEYSKLDSPKESEDELEESEENDNILENSVTLEEDLTISLSDLRFAQWQLYKTVTSINFNGTNPADPFMKLPSKKLYPEYFLDILEPMSLLMIKAKIKKNLYKNLEELVRDFDLVFNNAQQFNVEDSNIYKEAVKLQNLTHIKKQEFVNATQQINQDSPNKKRSNPVSVQLGSPSSSTPQRKTRPPMTPEELTQKRLQNIFQAIYNFQENNRFLRDIFMTLPSPDQYPDYYKIIPEPIDLTTIRKKIDDRKYETHMDLVKDLKLMFSNAKHYNEESSQVFQDSVKLEKLVKKKVKNIGASIQTLTRNKNKKLLEAGRTATMSIVQPSPTFATPIDYHTPFYRIREIFQTVKEYRDHQNRLLSEPFIKLPSRQDLPEYYEYIRKPIELSTIQHRINNERYVTVEDLMTDLNLMFDNACRFNEPDSQIYSDALILQRVALEKKAFLTKDDNLSEPPNIQETTQTILETLFQQFYDYVDEDGRFLVDSVNDIDGEIVNRVPIGKFPIFSEDAAANKNVKETCRLTLMKIRGDLMRRRYKRMDRLQEDVFTVLKHSREVSGINSQAYEDAYELQKLFITLRDIHCKRGEIFLTPALNYVERHLNQDVETENKERASLDTQEDDSEPNDEIEINKLKTKGNYRQLNSINRKDCIYEVGNYVKVLVEDKKSTYRVGEVTGIFVPNTDDCITESDDNSNQQQDGCILRVRWFYFPQETEHRPTRRFFEREVLMTPLYETVAMNMVVSKCFVIYVKDFRHNKITSFEPEDSFICECKYSPDKHTFKKLKIWTYKKDVKENFVKLNNPINPVRHYSQFPTISNNLETNEYNFDIENFNESVLQEDRSDSDFIMTYDQYVCKNGYIVKLGDYVYVKDAENKVQIVRIDSLWKDVRDHLIYFSGPWFINAVDIEHLPTKVFYKKEVFLSSVEPSTHILTSIVGKCVILCFTDYCEYRPTGYTEDNVYVCEFKYFTDDKVARKLKKGLKKIQLSTKALDDEIFFFSKQLVPNKQPSPLLIKYSLEPLKQEYITRLVCMSQTPLYASTSTNMNPQPTMSYNSSIHQQHPLIAHQQQMNHQLQQHNTNNDDDSKDASLNLNDDSMCNMSVTSSGTNTTTGNNNNTSSISTKERLKKPKKQNKKRTGPSGYVLYASEIRKKLVQDNPEAQFGDISREVGQLWRNMSQSEKDVYERKASEIKRVLEESNNNNATTSNNTSISSSANVTSSNVMMTSSSNPMIPSVPSIIDSQQMNAALLMNRQQQQQMGMSIINSRAYLPPQQQQQQQPPQQAVQYFQTPTGQLVQFLPNTATVSAPDTLSAVQQQQPTAAAVQLIQHSGAQQQVIYQLAPQQPGSTQPMLVNGGPSQVQQQQQQPSQFMMPNGSKSHQAQLQQACAPGLINNSNIGLVSSAANVSQAAAAAATATYNIQAHHQLVNNTSLANGGVGGVGAAVATANNIITSSLLQHNHSPTSTIIMTQANNSIVNTQMNQHNLVPSSLLSQQPQPPQQPLFVSVPPRSNRVFHSEIYQRYIERLRRNAPTLSDWHNKLDRPLTKDTVLERITGGGGPGAKQAYINKLVNEVAPKFLGNNINKPNNKTNPEQVVDQLFKLRDHMLRDALNIQNKLLAPDML